MANINLHELEGLLLERMGQVFKSVTMFDQMGASLLASVRQGIQAETGPDGEKWQALKPGTIKRRGSAHPILRHKKRLYDSITYKHDAEHAQVGTMLVYARIHQHGGAIERVGKTGAYSINMPARPYLYANDGPQPEAWKNPLRKIFMRHLKIALGQGEK